MIYVQEKMDTRAVFSRQVRDDKKVIDKCAAIVAVFLCTMLYANCSRGNTAKTGMRNITSAQLVADMGPGCNLGNTLDCECSGLAAETCWGNPYTTQAMIDKLAARGFKTLRIPVTWKLHLGAAPNYTIDKDWLDRVEVIANYAFKNDMYVIINTHHEGSWVIPTYAKKAAVIDELTKVWIQIASRFKDYGDYLLFETLNEPRLEGSAEEWNGGTVEGRDCVNQFHKAAADAIRATGGNNATRVLMVTPYAASTNPTAMSGIVIPNNDPRIVISLHSYFPYLYCLENQTTWGTATDKSDMDAQFDRIYNAFIAKGHPVVMGEWGTTNHNNITDRLLHGAYYVKKCKEKGISPVYWENGKASEFGLLSRTTLNWDFPDYADTIINSYRYKRCTSADQTAYIAVNDGPFQDVSSVTVNRGDSLRLKVVYTQANTAKWFLPDGTTASINELTITNVQFANSGTYAFVPASTRVCNSSTSLNVAIKVYQAEEYTSQSGLSTETATDVGGTQNIGFIQDGDWSTYTITIAKTGMYNISARVATNSTGGTIEYSVGGKVLGTTAVEDSRSNGWQDWYTTDPTGILLESGTYELKLTYKGAASYLLNVNWFDIQFSQDVQFVQLKRGWNIISTYLTNSSTGLGQIFPNASEIKTSNAFYSSKQPTVFNTLKTMEAGAGYLVYNTVNETIAIPGLKTQSLAQALEQGWNLVGVPSPTALPLATYPDLQFMKDFDGFYAPNNTLSTINSLEPGKGYFILK